MLDLELEIEKCSSEIVRLQVLQDELAASLAKEQERLSLLERLRRIDKPQASGAASNPEIAESKSLENAVVEYLRAAGKPMHVSVLRKRLVSDNIPLPGKGVDANVIARIRRDSRIIRSEGQRGYYAISPSERLKGG